MLKFHIAILASSVSFAFAAKPQYQHGNGGIGHDGFNTTIGEDTHTRALDGSHYPAYGKDFATPGWSLLDLSSRVYKTMTGSSTSTSHVDEHVIKPMAISSQNLHKGAQGVGGSWNRTLH